MQHPESANVNNANWLHEMALGRLCPRKAEGLGGERMATQPVALWLSHKRFLGCWQVGEGAPVAIYGEGKENAMAVGITKMSTQAMRELNKGIGVDNLHYLNDGLWKTPRV